MKPGTLFRALPFFWKLYIACMLLAALRMGEPGWEWAPASYSPWDAFMASAHKASPEDTELIVARSVTPSR